MQVTDRFELRHIEIAGTCPRPGLYRPDRRTHSNYDLAQLLEPVNVHLQALHQSGDIIGCQLSQHSTADSVYSPVSKIFPNPCGVSASFFVTVIVAAGLGLVAMSAEHATIAASSSSMIKK